MYLLYSKFILLFLRLHKLILHFSILHNSIKITSLYTVQVKSQIYIFAFMLWSKLHYVQYHEISNFLITSKINISTHNMIWTFISCVSSFLAVVNHWSHFHDQIRIISTTWLFEISVFWRGVSSSHTQSALSTLIFCQMSYNCMWTRTK
jgi:hypothetical protein